MPKLEKYEYYQNKIIKHKMGENKTEPQLVSQDGSSNEEMEPPLINSCMCNQLSFSKLNKK